MKYGIIILGAVLPYVTGVTADGPCLPSNEGFHPPGWKDIGGDEIRERYSSRVCSLININDDWHEEAKNSTIKECINYGDSRVLLELTSLEGPRVRYENCKDIVGKATLECPFGGHWPEFTAGPDSIRKETVNVELKIELRKGSCSN